MTHPILSYALLLLTGDAIDVVSEIKRKEKEAWWLSMLLGRVEGGLTELQGDAFSYEVDDHRPPLGGLGALLPILHTKKPRAYVAPPIGCDVTRDKEQALRRILVRLRQVGFELAIMILLYHAFLICFLPLILIQF